MKINAKYGIVAALTLAAFVAPSVGAYTVSGSSTATYTEEEEKAIQKCVSKAASLTGKVVTTETTASESTTYAYRAVDYTIYDDIDDPAPTTIGSSYKGINLTAQTDSSAVHRAICEIELQYDGTLMKDLGTVTPKQQLVDDAEVAMVQSYGGGAKNSTVSTDVAKAVTANMTTGVYKYVGNYMGDIKKAEKDVSDKKDAIKELNVTLSRAEADLADLIAEAKEALGKDATEAQINAYAGVAAAQTAVDDAKKAVADANDNDTAGSLGLKQLEKAVKDAKDAGVRAEKALSRAKADLATAKAKNAKGLAEAAETDLNTANATLKTLEESLKTATATTKEGIEKNIANQKKTIATIEGKIKALNSIANKAEIEADEAADAAKDENKSVSSATISGVARAYTYNGSAIVPTVTVTKAGAALNAGTDYTVSYTNNVKVGTATVTVTGAGEYTGSVSKTFYIDPAKSSIKKVSVGAKKMTVTVKKGKGATGVKIAYRVKGTSKWSYVTTTSTSKTIKSLKKGKKYQIMVRSYTSKSGKITNYSGWSSAKNSAKIK